MNGPRPSRGEVWYVNLDPVRGHEQAGSRPCLVISVDELNHGPAGLAIVLPITSKGRPISTRTPVDPPEGGLTTPSLIMCDQIRAVSTERFTSDMPLGAVSPQTLSRAERVLRILLDL
jgi:mRNA interferase MazF